MLEGGYLIGGVKNSAGDSDYSDVYLDGDTIVFSPLDPIHVSEDGDVFFSQSDKNAYMYSDSNGNVFVKVVN